MRALSFIAKNVHMVTNNVQTNNLVRIVYHMVCAHNAEYEPSLWLDEHCTYVCVFPAFSSFVPLFKGTLL